MLRVLLLLALSHVAIAVDFTLPFVTKKEYTPLLFFKLPPGSSPHCDAMEKVVREIEKDLNVKVQRLDVARDMSAERLYSLLSQELPPLLYHRESKQMIQLRINPDEEIPNLRIDRSRVRAWAKGRRLSTLPANEGGGAPLMFTSEEAGIDQEELMLDAGMTPLQRKGRKAIKERTDSLGR